MAYEKQEWKCSDTITADKMNHIEDGIESAGGGNDAPFYVLHAELDAKSGATTLVGVAPFDNSQHDITTWDEIVSILESGKYEMTAYAASSGAIVQKIGTIDVETQTIQFITFDYFNNALSSIYSVSVRFS